MIGYNILRIKQQVPHTKSLDITISCSNADAAPGIGIPPLVQRAIVVEERLWRKSPSCNQKNNVVVLRLYHEKISSRFRETRKKSPSWVGQVGQANGGGGGGGGGDGSSGDSSGEDQNSRGPDGRQRKAEWQGPAGNGLKLNTEAEVRDNKMWIGAVVRDHGGAQVKLECRTRDTSQVTYMVESVTDSTGSYNILVQDDREDEVCEAVLVKSSDHECNIPSSGRDRARVILTRNNGMNSNARFANAMGFLKNEPLASCPQVLQKYQETED
ncbi:unnamed protein product [Fraxinus pennsylvanica]|uniref:Pollen Ole e 1 allergen and extensin family protein n=1 Tax=Fraxinus pennsylvanica TaxID=56036 RepID=A0AAD1ZAE7_9LAMI|nr:unnamed protein product [Fraxinus pennsylvanica]